MSQESSRPFIKLSSRETKDYWEIPVLFEDAALFALEKPAKLLTSPDRYDPKRPNLMKLLHRDIQRGAPWAVERQLQYLSNAHRLDFETSGVILMAKSKPVLIKLAESFGGERAKKSYIALVHGIPIEDEFEVDKPLAPHPIRPEVMRIDQKGGKKSLTRFKVLERFNGYSLLECNPVTGRTHQIRVHAKYAGFPVVADSLYGGSLLQLSRLKKHYRLKPFEVEKPLIGRVALHAQRLIIPHPLSGEEVVIECDRPRDIELGLKYLRRYAI